MDKIRSFVCCHLVFYFLHEAEPVFEPDILAGGEHITTTNVHQLLVGLLGNYAIVGALGLQPGAKQSIDVKTYKNTNTCVDKANTQTHV